MPTSDYIKTISRRELEESIISRDMFIIDESIEWLFKYSSNLFIHLLQHYIMYTHK